MTKDFIFPYTWHVKDDDDNCNIYIYGLGTNNENISVKVIGFTPYVYLELPSDHKWNEGTINILNRKIDELCGHDDERLCKRGCLCSRPVKKRMSYRKKLYFANVNKHDDEYKYKSFPFLMLSFSCQKFAKQFSYKARQLNGKYLPGVGNLKGFKVHEQDAKPELQLACIKDIPTAGWIQFKGEENIGDENKETYCDKEYVVKWRHLAKYEREDIPKPRILSFDIEVNSSDPNRMPNVMKPKDKVFQISCVMATQGDENYEKYLLTLGEPDSEVVGEDCEIWQYKTEADLLDGFADFIVEKNPQLIIGYNILGFDIPYMIDRADSESCLCSEFRKFGCRIGIHAENKTIKWSSSAYGTQEFQFLDAEGRLFVDLLPLIKRDYKFDNYKLKTVSEFFLGETKDPLTAKGIFKCYRIGMTKKDGEFTKKAQKAMGIVGKYCVQDSALVLKLFDTIQTWVGLCEMAKTCNVPIFYLYTQGQQIKVFSQVYKHCMYNNFVVEKDGYEVKENEQYTGAYVVQPIPGAYDRVVPFDFTSLYPTTIIAYNIDYSTLVDPYDKTIPDEDCNVIEWEDHVGCEHDTSVRATKPKSIICAKHRYRFLKEPMGVIPTLLQNLLNARKKTKGEMKDAKKKANATDDPEEKEKWETRYTVLNKRQLAFKVSANSMYGAMGVKRGYLPFLPGAMCTTARGRQSIELAGETIQKNYNAQLVYGDTDSCYIHFPELKTAEECWDFCLKVENELLSIFPPPMKLAFEEVVYWRFFILTKKRYMALSCGRDGIVEDKIMKKGVLLARRDNSKFIREIYEKVIMKIFNKADKVDVINTVVDCFNKLFSNQYNYKDFVITKSVGDINDYKIREMPTDYKKRQKRLKDLGIFFHDPSKYQEHMKQQMQYYNKYKEKGQLFDDYIYNIKDTYDSVGNLVRRGECRCCQEEYGTYKLKSLPAQVQLAEKMRRRGMRVDPGSRIEYLVTTQGGIKGKQFEKIEDPDYQQEHSDVIKIDYLYYVKLAANPLDQAINVAYKDLKTKIVDEQYKLRLQKHKIIEQLNDMFTNISFD